MARIVIVRAGAVSIRFRLRSDLAAVLGTPIPTVGTRRIQLGGFHHPGAIQRIAQQLMRLGISSHRLSGSFHLQPFRIAQSARRQA